MRESRWVIVEFFFWNIQVKLEVIITYLNKK
jgi:hypothetical protein